VINIYIYIYIDKFLGDGFLHTKLKKKLNSMNKKQIINFSFYKTKSRNTIIYKLQCKNQKLFH
jgi:hypothetical protein